MNIYIAFPLTQSEQNILTGALQPDDQCFWAQTLTQDERFDAFAKADVIFGNVSASWLEQNNNLKWVQLYSAGFDQYLPLDWDNKLARLTVTNLRGFFGEPVAETAVAGIMALYRKMDELARLQVQRKWVGSALRPDMHLLHRKNAIILGAGAIGDTIRKILEAFSCSIQTVSRRTKPTLEDLNDLLPDADIVIATLPDTPETKHVFNQQRFGRMKETAVLVNVGRGSAVDEAALLEALQQSRLGGAVLDVTEQEPLPENHPLWTCPNVILTQHTGGGYDAENADKVRVFIANLQRFRQGEPLQNIVDFKRGY